MPIHIYSTRRFFLQTAVAATAATVLPEFTASGGEILFFQSADKKLRDEDGRRVDPASWIFMSDTHIAGDKTICARDANMFANLSRAIDEILALDRVPAGVVVNGDCAYLEGDPADYATFVNEIKRIPAAGLPLHMTMGNHDDRSEFYKAFAIDPNDSAVENKHASLVETSFANFILLDSLQFVNKVTGELGSAQRQWLDEILNKHSDRPAIVFCHHNPQVSQTAADEVVSGLADTAELMEILNSHAQVKAFIYGHTHQWNLKKTDAQMHLVNLPPVAYLFEPSQPNGWVHAQFEETGMTLTVHAFDAKNSVHMQEHQLVWR